MNKNVGQPIFRYAAVERLRHELRSGASLKSYFQESFVIKDEEFQPSTIIPQGETPVLEFSENSQLSADIANAIGLHEYYQNLDETQASDPRLWTYLSHIQFREYTRARWHYDAVYEDLSDEEKVKAINYFLEHWFVGSNDRDLRRHAIARLWWAAHLTYAPWESDPEFFGDLEKDDRYYYTRVLLSSESVFADTLERAMGRSNRILITVLDYFARNADFTSPREKMRSLMKELNLAYGTKKIITLSRDALNTLIEKTAAEISLKNGK